MQPSRRRVVQSSAKRVGMERAPALTMEEQLDPLTNRIIGCAITLHRFLGPGLLESVYRNGLAIEMGLEGIAFNREQCIGV
jgi:hypothetical protein